ncbi:MORN repeat-containing protein 3-like [Clarias gariepinus]|uniref:MORN repeat-containing protein 3-like n=1 Tax=Clarias gariepinus TaxID=13013 RepID=UPI00234DE5EC|nr:MORN repeat-containing protein 3-like [Clarias gariepinus]
MALIGKISTKESRVKGLEDKAQKNGPRHTFYSPNGDSYTGEWLSDLRHGYGTQVWKRDGVRYEGEWKRDGRDGLGTLYRRQPPTQMYKTVYLGGWKTDKKDGFGTYFYSDAARYEGMWVQNERSEFGKMMYENGDVYEGEWFRDKPHGQGVLVLRNGNRYEGYMKDGKKHGHGRFIYKDKCQVYEGFWENDFPTSGTMSDYHGKHVRVQQKPAMDLQENEAFLMHRLGPFCTREK